MFARPSSVEGLNDYKSVVQSKIRHARESRRLSPAVTNRRLTAHAEAQLRAYLGDSGDPDVKAIGAIVSKQLAKEPIPGLKGISVASQVMADSSQFEVPAALMRDAAVQYGLALGQASPAGKRPVLKVLLVVGL